MYNDLRYGLRMLRHSPRFTLIALLTLGLGIGANTVIFSVVNGVLLKPLPFPDPDRLVTLWECNPRRGLELELVSGPNFIDWRVQNRVFDNIAFSSGGIDLNLVNPDGVEKVEGTYALSSLFSVLGVNPLLGRTFLPEEDQWQGNRVAVIGHDLWQQRFGGDQNVLGRTLTVDSYGRRDYTIVGVMPQGFRVPDQCELWLPFGWLGVRMDERRSAHWHHVIARLKAGVTLDEAQKEMNSIQARIEQQHPSDLIGSQVAIVPLLEQTLGRNLRLALLILWVAVTFILLIACANVANLLLARAAVRQKEIAVRLALGASRWQVIRQLLTESVMLSLFGGAVGLLLASWSLNGLIAIAAAYIPRLQEVTLDTGALVFTFLISSLTGLLFGLTPAWQFSRPDLNETLRNSSRIATGNLQRSRLRSLLVILEIAISLVLLIGAELMIKSFERLVHIDRGFQPDHLLAAKLDFSVSGFSTWVEPTSTRPQVTLQEIMKRIRNQPGVLSVGAVSVLPMETGNAPTQAIVIEKRPPITSSGYPTASFSGITPDYFRTMRIRLLRGRPFAERDVHEAPGVVIINETMAKRYFSDIDPIGKRLAMGGRKNLGQPETANPGQQSPWSEIVGVVADVKKIGLNAETVPDVYVPYWQWPMQSPILVVRTVLNPASIATEIRKQVRAVNRHLPMPAIHTMDEILAHSVAQPRFQTILLSLFGIIALLLATVGTYGVVSYSATQRTWELGIRMALGAEKADVLRLVLGDGMRLVLVGVGIGLIAAFALTRFMSSLVYQVKATDPETFVSVTLLLSAVVLIASWFPARRATKLDPNVALPYE